MARKLMNAVQYDSFGGGVASLKHVEIPVPALKKGEILIKMEAASLNSVDLKIQNGLMRPILIPRKLPFTPATDIAGEVVEVGTGVTKFKAGDKVVSYLGLSYYLSLNRLRCCTKGICTECFLQMKISNSTRPTQCPFCKTLNYAVEYRGVKTKEEKGIEQIEEQRVIEAKIRMRQQELQDEELRMLTRQEISSSSRSMLPGEVGYSTGEVDEEIVSYQIPLRQSLRPRQNSVAAE